MTATLQEMLFAPEIRSQLIADCQALVEQELATKSGMSATGIKVAYKAVTTFAPGYYQDVIVSMVPPIADQLQPFWADFNASGGSDFGDYLSKRSEEVTEALLSVTDSRAAQSQHASVVKAYTAVRGSAGTNIAAALPSLGAMLAKYA